MNNTLQNTPANALALVRRRAEPDDPTLPAILEFQWPSTAIVNAPIPRLARNMVWLITSMVVSMVFVMGVIPLDQVVTARGVVVSKSPTVLVQPLETAIVRSIEVREGQSVKAGDVLARLDPTFAAADLASLTGQVAGLEAEVARLQAEAADKPFTYTSSEPGWVLQGTIFEHRKAQLEARIDNYRHRGSEFLALINRAQSDIVGYRERLNVAKNIEQMHVGLEKIQAGSRLNVLLAKDSRAEMERALASAEQTAEGALRDQDALTSERDAFIRGWQAEVSQKLAEVSGRAAEARELLNKAKLRRELVELRSEVDAIVQSVAKVSVGSVMQSGQQFISLVPADTALEIEANILGRDNGFVHVNNPAVIKFDTFPFSQFGLAEGTVRVITPDSFTAQSEARNPTSAVPLSTSEPFYRGRISIDHVGLHDVPAGFRIIPGMPVTADIKVGKRTVLQYLIGMILPIATEGMREP